MNKGLAEINAIAKALQKINRTFPELLKTLDTLTREHTAFPDFSAMIHQNGNYFPELHKNPEDNYDSAEIVMLPNPGGRKTTCGAYYAELDLLALTYDMAQLARNDPRRAFRS